VIVNRNVDGALIRLAARIHDIGKITMACAISAAGGYSPCYVRAI
jgi:HD superfamily phosphodiesterase